jgi:holliday junction DNA helicase RuvA
MINLIYGTVEAIFPKQASIRTGPLCLTCFIPSTDSFIVGSSITLYTHLYWSAEQGPTLYGFETSFARSVFIVLLECSGVGPKLALSVLADLGALEFVQAIQTEDTKRLSSVSGIGLKKAEQLLVQVRHKIDKLIILSGSELRANSVVSQWNELTQVLASLHYSKGEIDHAVMQLKQEGNTAQMPFDLMMRKALSFLAKKR